MQWVWPHTPAGMQTYCPGCLNHPPEGGRTCQLWRTFRSTATRALTPLAGAGAPAVTTWGPTTEHASAAARSTAQGLSAWTLPRATRRWPDHKLLAEGAQEGPASPAPLGLDGARCYPAP